MKKQTAVEWLLEQHYNNISVRYNGFTHEQIEQAKAMEKEQIIKACKFGNNFEQGDLRCEVYYKETYEKTN